MCFFSHHFIATCYFFSDFYSLFSFVICFNFFSCLFLALWLALSRSVCHWKIVCIFHKHLQAACLCLCTFEFSDINNNKNNRIRLMCTNICVSLSLSQVRFFAAESSHFFRILLCNLNGTRIDEEKQTISRKIFEILLPE